MLMKIIRLIKLLSTISLFLFTIVFISYLRRIKLLDQSFISKHQFASEISEEIPNLIQNNRNRYDVLVVGAGISGAVLAHLHAKLLNQTVLLIEKRNHIAGNCYDFVDQFGIRVSQYGLHVFHTSDPSIWLFLSQFTKWLPYQHRVVGRVGGKLFPIPLNIDSINLLFNENIETMIQMKEWLKLKKDYDFYPKENYTTDRKHYHYFSNIDLKSHIRKNFDDRYFSSDIYQALPAQGYTKMIKRMLSHSNIKLQLNSDFFEMITTGKIKLEEYPRIFYTGKVDQYFSNSKLPNLEYDHIRFNIINLINISFYQSTSVVLNSSGNLKSSTKLVEYKHLYSEHISNCTTIVHEIISEHGEPCYPLLTKQNSVVYRKYLKLAKFENRKGIYFIGRLAEFKYFEMDQAVENAIEEFRKIYKEFDLTFSDYEIYGNISLSNSLNIFWRPKNKPSLSLIISRCRDSISWLKRYAHLCFEREVTIYIYNKCEPVIIPDIIKFNVNCRVTVIELNNVGREGHSWLYHLLYKSLNFRDINIFLQGKPHYHRHRDVMRIISDMSDNLKSFTYEDYVNIRKSDLSEHFQSNGPVHCVFSGLNFNNHSNYFCQIYAELTGTKENCSAAVGNFGGEFIVTEALLRRILASHRVWIESLFFLLSRGQDPIEGHYMERLWTTLFKWPSYHEVPFVYI